MTLIKYNHLKLETSKDIIERENRTTTKLFARIRERSEKRFIISKKIRECSDERTVFLRWLKELQIS